MYIIYKRERKKERKKRKGRYIGMKYMRDLEIDIHK